MNLQLMKKLCNLNEEKIYKILLEYLFSCNYKVFHKDNYIYAEGTLPICLLAHMDTVFKAPPAENQFIYDQEQSILWAPYGAGFDDRAGIYCIIAILESGLRPSLVFTKGEESGGIGANDLIADHPKCPFHRCNALIQLDRANYNDSVFYNCDNQRFEDYINKYGFKTDLGTFTDISIIAPSWKIAAVNLSVGYVDEHSESERLYCNWCDETIEKVKKIVEESVGMPYFKYIPYKFTKQKN